MKFLLSVFERLNHEQDFRVGISRACPCGVWSEPNSSGRSQLRIWWRVFVWSASVFLCPCIFLCASVFVRPFLFLRTRLSACIFSAVVWNQHRIRQSQLRRIQRREQRTLWWTWWTLRRLQRRQLWRRPSRWKLRRPPRPSLDCRMTTAFAAWPGLRLQRLKPSSQMRGLLMQRGISLHVVIATQKHRFTAANPPLETLPTSLRKSINKPNARSGTNRCVQRSPVV